MTIQRIQIGIGILTLIVGGYLYAGILREEPVSLSGVGKPLFDEVGTQVYTDCDLRAPKRQNIENNLKNLKAKNQDNSLRALDAKERASLKGCEIAKIKTVPKGRVQFSGSDYEIEIVEMNPIEGGVEVFARAWTPDGQQIGFGPDGTVDIERFRIINPPVLVDDPNGSIVREGFNKHTNLVETRKLREDPLVAVLQSIAHTLSVKKEVSISSAIQTGKVGNTTTTVYPNASVETTSFDGAVATQDSDLTWATVRADTTGSYANDNATRLIDGAHGYGIGVWYYGSANDVNIVRGFTLFDTSAIPDGDTVSSATLSLHSTLTRNDFNEAEGTIVPVEATPASNTALADGDIDNVGSIAFATAIDLDTVSTTGYTDWTLNASGIANVSKTGVSKFAWRIGYDLNNTQPTYSAARVWSIYPYSADQTGTGSDPKLVVEHSAPPSATPTPAEIIFYN